jgi:small GTP-binding protein
LSTRFPRGSPTSAAKVILPGDVFVGKTSIVHRATANSFGWQLPPTVGVQHDLLLVESNGGQVDFTIWDTSGQEKYPCFVSMHVRDVQSAILVFDLSRWATFGSVDSWIKQLRDSVPDCEIALVGNKVDLAEEREVALQDGLAMADRLKCSFYSETSAATGQGVKELFKRFVTTPGIQRRLSSAVDQREAKQAAVALDGSGKPSKIRRPIC